MAQGLPDYFIGTGSRRLYQHNTTYSPVGLWQFDGSLVDGSGNGLDLVMSAGTATYCEPCPGAGIKGIVLGTTYAKRSSHDAALTIAGALTVEMIVVASTASSEFSLVHFQVPGHEVSASNCQYQLSVVDGQVKYFAEYGSGTNIGGEICALPVGVPIHLAMTRASDGVTVKIYLNGDLQETYTASHVPDGGGSAYLVVGDITCSHGSIISSLKIIASELNATQIASEANLCLGY